jgi:hypothetical protein
MRIIAGEGSPGPTTPVAVRGADVTASYILALRALIRSEGVSIVDLGCGNFEVEQRFLSPEHTEFRTLDLVTDSLPNGDLCIIRQVFKHLSNRDIATVLRKVREYRLLVVTDEQVVGDKSSSNTDIKPILGGKRYISQDDARSE